MARLSLVSAASALLLVVGSAQAAVKEANASVLSAAEAPKAATSPQVGDTSPYLRTGFLIPFNVAGIESRDPRGSVGNPMFNINLGVGGSMTGVSWDVVLTAPDPSWRNEIAVTFSDSAGGQAITLRPGAADASPGGPTAYASGGVVKFASIPLPNINVLADGILKLEFHETFDDFPGAVDGFWNSGTLGIQVIPAPGAIALFGLSGLVAARRRRA